MIQSGCPRKKEGRAVEGMSLLCCDEEEGEEGLGGRALTLRCLTAIL